MRLIDADELYKILIKDDYLPDDYINVIIVKLAILTTPEVEAIPKEWIEKYAKKLEKEDNGSQYGYVSFSTVGQIYEMLNEWEKENG